MISLADAKRIIAAAGRKAELIGQPMNIAVVDDGGNLVAHVRMGTGWTFRLIGACVALFAGSALFWTTSSVSGQRSVGSSASNDTSF